MAVAQLVCAVHDFQLLFIHPRRLTCSVVRVNHVNEDFVHAHDLRRLRIEGDVMRDVFEHLVIACGFRNQAICRIQQRVGHLRQHTGPIRIEDLVKAPVVYQARVIEVDAVPVMVQVPTVLQFLCIGDVFRSLWYGGFLYHVQVLGE